MIPPSKKRLAQLRHASLLLACEPLYFLLLFHSWTVG